MNKKRLISSLLTIALCLSMIAGSTFALFTGKDTVDVSVNAAKVNITANVENIALSSMGIASADGKTFANGGTAEFDEENGVFTLTNIAPGDKVNFDIKITNNSNITIQYRVKWAVYGELLGALEAKLGDTEITNGVSEWTPWTTAEANTKTLNLSLELPTEAGDEYQEKTAKVAFLVEAVQGNGVAYLPGEQYASSEEGLRAAFANGGDIVLNNNIALENGSLVVPAGKTVNLDLNGCVISADSADPTIFVEAGGVLNTKDSAASGVATFARRTFAMTRGGVNNDNGNAIKNSGAVTLAGGQYTSGKGYALNNESSDSKLTATNIVGGGAFNAGELELNNCELLNEVSDRHTVYNSGILTVNGGIYENTSANEVIKSPSAVAAVINSGSFIMTGKSYLLGGNIIINGGNFVAYDNGDGTTDKMCPNGANDSINVNGGSFNFDVTGWIETNEIMEENNGEYTVVYGLLYFADRNEYQLSSVEALIWFADEVNQYSNYEHPFEGETVKLMSDIDLEGMEWTPIGDYRFQANRFCGTFDGQGNTISNFQISKKTDKNDSNKSSYGFFGNVDGTVKNLTIDNASVKSYAYVGALIGRLNGGTVENCHVSNSKVECTYWQAGGMIGQLNSSCTVKDCSISGTTITGSSAIGGMFGPLTVDGDNGVNTGVEIVETATIDNCLVDGCEIIQKGSFGANYDKLFGAMFADIDVAAEDFAYISECKAQKCKIKGEDSNALFNSIAGTNVFFDGYQYISDGVFTKNGEYYISNANGLLWIEAQTDTFFAGKTIKLKNDIDCTDVAMKSLWLWSPENRTVFDGQDYTVYNLNISSASTSNQGLINGTVDIKNVRIDGAWIEGYGYVGALSGKLYGNVENCHVTNAQVFGSYWQTGVLVGQYSSGNITNCSVIDCKVYSPSAAGAIVGILNETAGERKIENCVVKNCAINANGGFGGNYDLYYGAFVGLINIENSSVYFNNCTSEGNTVKGIESNELYGDVESSTTVYVDGEAQ